MEKVCIEKHVPGTGHVYILGINNSNACFMERCLPFNVHLNETENGRDLQQNRPAPDQKGQEKIDTVRTEWIGIVSCFVKPHPSSTKLEETFHPHPHHALCFVRACDGWRAWRHTPADLIHHQIITKGLADWDDLLHPLACYCQTTSFSKDNSVTSTLPPQNKPTLMKDCCMSIKEKKYMCAQIHCYSNQLGYCTWAAV